MSEKQDLNSRLSARLGEFILQGIESQRFMVADKQQPV